jgi:hypothetical protein
VGVGSVRHHARSTLPAHTSERRKQCFPHSRNHVRCAQSIYVARQPIPLRGPAQIPGLMAATIRFGSAALVYGSHPVQHPWRGSRWRQKSDDELATIVSTESPSLSAAFQRRADGLLGEFFVRCPRRKRRHRAWRIISIELSAPSDERFIGLLAHPPSLLRSRKLTLRSLGRG